MSSKHGQKMSDAFQKAETARRERLGKPTAAPSTEEKKEEKKETPAVEPFNISYGQRA